MARQTRSLKKELKSVSLPGPQGQTCEFCKNLLALVDSILSRLVDHRWVCESAHRGVTQQPEEVDQDAQQLCAGGWKQGLPTLLQQPWLPSSGLLIPFKTSITWTQFRWCESRISLSITSRTHLIGKGRKIMILNRMWYLYNTFKGLTAVKAEKEVECQVERAVHGWHRHRFENLLWPSICQVDSCSSYNWELNV